MTVDWPPARDLPDENPFDDVTASPTVLVFGVRGAPATQGSKRAFVVGARAVVVDDNKAPLRSWREAIRATALHHALSGGWEMATGPVAVSLWFNLRRPSSAPKRRRTWPTGARSGDVDKLTRGVLDALTDAGIWRDDAQVVDLYATKDYREPLGVRVMVQRYSTDPTPEGAS